MKRLTVRFESQRKKRVMNQLMRQREEQEEARRQYERQAELRLKVPVEEIVLCGCDREWLQEMAIKW
jgi:hypothetical protein